MLVEVKVPALSESVSEATLLEWQKQAGDAVNQDDVLVELETDKVVLEIVAPESGVLKEIKVASSTAVSSDELIATIDTEAQTQTAPTAATVEAPSASEKAPPQQQAANEAEVPLSPAVKKLVAEHKLDPNVIPGTGKDGRITKGDVLNFLDRGAPPAAPAPSAPAANLDPSSDRPQQRVAMSRLRSRIAERLVEAQQTAAILSTFNEIDMKPVMELRSKYKDKFEKEHDVKLGFMSFFTKAVIQGLKRFPVVNASVDGSDIVYHEYYDIGIAVGSPRGLVVPVVRNADQLTFAQLENQIVEYGKKARDGKLSMEELTGGTFTISNGGVFGSLLSTPIINPPQSGILGMHKIQQRPVVVDGEIVVRPMMYVALSYDHRIIDGREAVSFLVTVKDALEDPARLLLDI